MSQTASDTGASLHIIEMTSKTERREMLSRDTQAGRQTQANVPMINGVKYMD